MLITSDCLLPTLSERLAQARSDLAMGLPCLLTHEGNRVVVVAVETVPQARFDALCQRFGPPELILTAQRARAIMPTADDIEDPLVRLHPPASAGLAWFKDLSDTQFDVSRRPTGPLHVIRGPQTPVHALGIRLVKMAELLPAIAMFSVANETLLNDLPLVALDSNEALATLLIPPALTNISAAALPLEAHDHGRLHIFRGPDGGKEHCAIEIGQPDRSQPVLARVHSACFTGDVLGSLKCDCGPQLRAALACMGQEGAGVLLYLNQEGRGIGLANKMRVYDLQAQGLDTVEANHHLGYHDDERDFQVAAAMLCKLGFTEIRLLTNNPAKLQTFRDGDIKVVEHLPLRVGRNTHNQDYLAVKALKSGHSL